MAVDQEAMKVNTVVSEERSEAFVPGAQVTGEEAEWAGDVEAAGFVAQGKEADSRTCEFQILVKFPESIFGNDIDCQFFLFGRHCEGQNIRYRTCSNHDCSPDAEDFRAQQCSAYNDVQYQGRYYEWLPRHNDPTAPCALKCQARGQNVVVELAPKVLDGTRCNTDSLDMCISGICQHITESHGLLTLQLAWCQTRFTDPRHRRSRAMRESRDRRDTEKQSTEGNLTAALAFGVEEGCRTGRSFLPDSDTHPPPADTHTPLRERHVGRNLASRDPEG
ncbi:ADAMTS-like protein 3 [Pteropus alecto]|uniref:ADAMTS-like protein 3 n=1 Tax=Pteropus alecto TaxID=9402 RepID=L5L5J3_PTEAL|nr:ADAMTS-like protein 3 [Pteropus alecto]